MTGLCVSAFSIHAAIAQPPVEIRGLWVGNGGFISEFQGAAITSSGTPDAHLAFRIKEPFQLPYSIAFDPHDNLWITDLGGRKKGDVAFVEVKRAAIASIKAGQRAQRRRVVPSGPGVATRDWFALAFDRAGDLFVTGQDELLVIPPDRLTQLKPSPTIVISSTQWNPQALRFDRSDNLWVSAGNGQVWKFTPADRTASGTASPSLIVNLPTNFGAGDIALDGSGTMWLAGEDFATNDTEIEMISATNLDDSGEITPPIGVTITSAAFGAQAGLPGGPCLGGIDFDQSGNLWASARCGPNSHLLAFTPSQLSIGGDLTPSVIIGQNSSKNNLAFPGPIRFGPTVN